MTASATPSVPFDTAAQRPPAPSALPLRWLPMLLSAACLVLLGLPLSAAGVGAQLQVAVAANFRATLQQLAPEFTRASGDTLLISAGSSGQLAAQIQQGAPYDVFLSADAQRPALLEKQGLAVPGSRFTYAIGTLVLWSSRAGFIDTGGTVLEPQHYRHLAVADPRNAPYGAAAQQLLQGKKLWDTLNQHKQIVLGENITQTWQFVASGNAELGFVAMSQVRGPDGRIRGSYWVPPQSLYSPIDQDAVILAHSRQQAAARAFTHWLRTAPAALAAIHAAGYRTLAR